MGLKSTFGNKQIFTGVLLAITTGIYLVRGARAGDGGIIDASDDAARVIDRCCAVADHVPEFNPSPPAAPADPAVLTQNADAADRAMRQARAAQRADPDPVKPAPSKPA